MSHTFEEIRSVAMDIIAGREPMISSSTQYEHLSLSIGNALARRENRINPTHQGATYPLDHEDREMFLELFWDLFRQGVITLGYNDANREFPFYRATALGKQIAAGADAYFFHDVSSYEATIRAAVPEISPVTVVYLKEAMQAFKAGCMLSATVMLGVAAEHTFDLLLEAIGAGSYAKHFTAAAEARAILTRFNKFRTALEPLLQALPQALREDLDTHLSGILSVIRTLRNESGHPTGKIMDREQTYVLLQLTITYLKKQYQLMQYFQPGPAAKPEDVYFPGGSA